MPEYRPLVSPSDTEDGRGGDAAVRQVAIRVSRGSSFAFFGSVLSETLSRK